MTYNAPYLLLTTSRDGDSVTLAVEGDVDLATAGQLREAAVHAIVFGPGHLHLDLTKVGFCDSSGLHVLLATRRRANLAGVRLTVAPSPPVQRVLDLAGVHEILHDPAAEVLPHAQ